MSEYGDQKSLQEILEELALHCLINGVSKPVIDLVLPKTTIDQFNMQLKEKNPSLKIVGGPTVLYSAFGTIRLHDNETKIIENIEQSKLKQYLELLEEGLSSLDNDLLFQEILKKSETILMLSDSNLAREIQLSVPTIKRWRTGKNTPFPLMRTGIYTWLKKRTSLKQMESK